MYNPYFNNNYIGNQPTGNPYQYFQPTQNVTAPMRTEVTKVRGRQSAMSINLAPNSSILLLDETAPIVWLCTSDGIGTVTAIPYDIAPHEDKPSIDIGSLEERISKLEETINAKSNDKYVKSKSNGKPEHDAG